MAVLDLSCIGLRMTVLHLSCIGLRMALLALLRAKAATRIWPEEGCFGPETGFASGKYNHPNSNMTDRGPVTGPI